LTTPCSEKETLAILKDGSERREKKLDKIIEILNGSDDNPGLKGKVYLHSKYFKIISVISVLALTGKLVWSYILQ
jgi:hypothetical protein